jgi:hypothetical protein
MGLMLLLVARHFCVTSKGGLTVGLVICSQSTVESLLIVKLRVAKRVSLLCCFCAFAKTAMRWTAERQIKMRKSPE